MDSRGRGLAAAAMLGGMDIIEALLKASDGVVTAAELRCGGLDTFGIRSAVEGGRLAKIRRGTFVDGARWAGLAAWERHDLRARAVLHALDPDGQGPYALSHHSALVVLGVSHFGTDDDVHMVRTDGVRGRRANALVVHEALPEDQVHTTPAGVRVVGAAVACLQVAVRFGTIPGLVSTDSALHLQQTTHDDLVAARTLFTARPGRRALQATLDRATGEHESAGETRCSEVMLALGLLSFERQVWIRDLSGAALGRVDFLFRSRRTIVEFDGLMKYTSPEVLRQEKLREDRLRALGYEVVRLTWADLDDPGRVHELITAAFARADARAA
ncbi:DUF559 domain-containing protein [Ornithinimicrobium tianjinense]|uniref:DUF559 domain-containing protein n=1 Tax=Ornithinimicrobium tianjinense TaxID=1195761 RepID=A0A917BQI7_9MICO|nr:DUF559 domain-containing protein [Ornithinimicrobium tianjinense]GGF54985.1 hypothetical protein GCM10011366_23590 [Ornithinimicrobium tianjinense]